VSEASKPPAGARMMGPKCPEILVYDNIHLLKKRNLLKKGLFSHSLSLAFAKNCPYSIIS
jgi:hypothetical protein